MTSSPIKDVLRALNQHWELVEQGFSGVVSGDGQGYNNAIAALRQVSALRAAGEDGYRLHPRLRDFLQDHLQLFPAFQSLAEIGSRISQVLALWTEVDLMRKHSDAAAIQSLLDSIQSTVFDIGDSMDRNMLLLQTLVATRYGNVRSLEAKKSQNRYYQKQTSILADDLIRLAKVCDQVEREAAVRGMEDLARFLRRNLLSRVMAWQQNMTEMQTLIRREIFRMFEVEQNLKQLARIDMLFRQQPSWRGFELDSHVPIPDFLMRAKLPTIAPHAEPLDTDHSMLNEMQQLAASLPPKPLPASTQEPPKRYIRIIDPPHVSPPSPAALAMNRLVTHVQRSQAAFSLSKWRFQDTDALTLQSHVWLAFAVIGLRSRKYRVDLVTCLPREHEKFTHTFDDAVAYPSELQTARVHAIA